MLIFQYPTPQELEGDPVGNTHILLQKTKNMNAYSLIITGTNFN